jgi:hypothetical protein
MSDLFSILCTTCKTRLRVRDAAVIGQILACPKCSSMVLVEAPPGWAPPAPGESKPSSTPASNGNMAARNGSAILKKPASSTSLPVAKPLPTPATAAAAGAKADPSLKETLSDSQFAEVEALLGDSGIRAKPSAQVETKPARAKADVPAGKSRIPTAAPPPPAEMAAAASTELLSTASPSTTSPSATSLSATSPSTTSPSSPAIDAVPHSHRRFRLAALLTIGGLMGVSLAISAAYLAVTWNSKPKEIVENPSTPIPPASDSPVRPPDEQNSETVVLEPTSDKAPSLPPEKPEPDKPEPDKPEPETTDPQPPMPPRDPLNLVNDAPKEAGPLDLEKLKNQFKGLQEDGNTPTGEPATPEPSTDSPSPAELPEAPPSRPRPEMRKVDLAARLADRLLEIEFTGQSLAEVLQFLSDFSTIPITLDPEALPWSKASASSPINLDLKNVTLDEVLTEVLKPLRLEAVKLEGQIVVTRSSALRKLKCPIDDLATTDAAKQQLAELVMALAAPETWKPAGGPGSLTPQGGELQIDNTELAYGDVLHVCERLRQARGLRTKSVFPPELFALEPRTARAAAKLDQPLTLNFGQPTPLVKILSRLGEETGLQIVVDWQAAGEIGWPPEADATVTLNKMPLGDALVKLLAPLELTYRVVDGKTLQVTTPQAIQHKPELELYKAGDLANTPEEGAALIEKLSTSLGGTPVLRWDAPSKSLLALLPQPQQVKLAQLLADARPKEPEGPAK